MNVRLDPADYAGPLERLALAGIATFPCNEHKRPLVPGGFKSATADHASALAWAVRFPECLPAVPTGPSSGTFIVDCDVHRETGETIGEDTIRTLGIDPAAHPFAIRTRSGGWHLPYRWREGLPTSAGRIGRGVDTRGPGGYVIAWDPDALAAAARTGDLPELPAVLRDRLIKAEPDREPRAAPEPRAHDNGREAAYAQTVLDAAVAEVAAAPEGERNDKLNRVAHRLGRFVGSGHLGESEVVAALEDACRANGTWADDGAHQCRATIRSGLHSGTARPWGGLPERADDGFDPDTLRIGGDGARQDETAGEDTGAEANEGEARRDEGAGEEEDEVPPRRKRLSGRTAADWEGERIKDRPWLVRGLIPGRNVSLLQGDGGTGKSLLALQLAVSTAGRRSWLGREVCDQGPAIFLTAEDEGDEVHRRAADVIRPLELRFRDLANLHIESLAGEDALLARENKDGTLSATPLMVELHALAADVRPRLIVLDTLADLFPSNENDRAKVRAFVSMLRKLAMANDCAVVLLGHPSVAGMQSGTGTSGSTAWSNSVRSRLYLSRETIEGIEADADVRVLSSKKQQHSRTGETIRLRWKDGAFVVENTGGGASGEQPAAKAERVFLELLDRFAGQGRRVNGNSGVNYAPRVFAEHPDAEGCTKRHLANAMNRLFDAGEIETREVRENSKPVRFIARVETASDGREDDE